jgi:hypothetical protein
LGGVASKDNKREWKGLTKQEVIDKISNKVVSRQVAKEIENALAKK